MDETGTQTTVWRWQEGRGDRDWMEGVKGDGGNKDICNGVNNKYKFNNLLEKK